MTCIKIQPLCYIIFTQSFCKSNKPKSNFQLFYDFSFKLIQNKSKRVNLWLINLYLCAFKL